MRLAGSTHPSLVSEFWGVFGAVARQEPPSAFAPAENRCGGPHVGLVSFREVGSTSSPTPFSTGSLMTSPPTRDSVRNFAEEFLTFPDLFPSRHSGERWGGRTVTIDFAGGPYRFDGLSSTQADELRDHYRDLLVADDAPPSSTVAVFKVDSSDFRQVRPRWMASQDRLRT